MDFSTPNWLDLPPGIHELIINKLHFADQFRAFAVCKNWGDCKDHVKCSDCLPWVICHQRVPDIKSNVHSFICELFDPYSQKVHQVSKNLDPRHMYLCSLASKQGWLLFNGGEYSTLFLYNPFTNDIFSVSTCIETENMQATINGNPTSPECEIFVLTILDSSLCIDTYKRSGGLMSEIIVGGTVDDELLSVLHINGNIYCLLLSGTLNVYNLEDGSWRLLTSGFPEPYKSYTPTRGAWLLEINGNLIMVCTGDAGNVHKWIIFRFGLSEMSWVVETGLKSCAIYISDMVAFSAPLRNRCGETLEGCRVFYNNRFRDVCGGRGFKCYSLGEAGGAEIQSDEEYGWITRPWEFEMSFIEPPYIGI